MTKEITISRRLAPEDITPGTFIAISAQIHEVYPPWLLGVIPGQRPEPVRLTCLGCADGEPRRVLATCLPFVMTENARGYVETIDSRLSIIIQVDEMYALEQFTRPEPAGCSE